MKKIIFLIIYYFLIFVFIANATSLKDDMIPNSNNVWVSGEWTSVISEILIYIKDFLFSILWIIAVWVFLYFWFKLITARWNDEEFKKTLMWFLYAVIGLAIIPLAWSAVKIISTLKF